MDPSEDFWLLFSCPKYLVTMGLSFLIHVKYLYVVIRHIKKSISNDLSNSYFHFLRLIQLQLQIDENKIDKILISIFSVMCIQWDWNLLAIWDNIGLHSDTVEK